MIIVCFVCNFGNLEEEILLISMGPSCKNKGLIIIIIIIIFEYVPGRYSTCTAS